MRHLIAGDTVSMSDIGTARADSPGGDAATFYHCIEKILSFLDDTRIFLCKDYCEENRELESQTSVKAEREGNNQLRGNEEDDVAMGEQRDSTLDLLHFILPSLQVNMRAEGPPPVEDDDTAQLKLPINLYK